MIFTHFSSALKRDLLPGGPMLTFTLKTHQKKREENWFDIEMFWGGVLQ